MSETKVELIENPLTLLPEELGHKITKHLSLQEFSRYLRTSKNLNAFFTYPIFATKVQTCVAE